LEHDRAYGKAKTQEDIDKADDQFINDYISTPANSPVEYFHKGAGLFGIGAKRVAISDGDVILHNLEDAKGGHKGSYRN